MHCLNFEEPSQGRGRFGSTTTVKADDRAPGSDALPAVSATPGDGDAAAAGGDLGRPEDEAAAESAMPAPAFARAW